MLETRVTLYCCSCTNAAVRSVTPHLYLNNAEITLNYSTFRITRRQNSRQLIHREIAHTLQSKYIFLQYFTYTKVSNFTTSNHLWIRRLGVAYRAQRVKIPLKSPVPVKLTADFHANPASKRLQSKGSSKQWTVRRRIEYSSWNTRI